MNEKDAPSVNPAFAKETLLLKNNEQVEFRPLQYDDVEKFGTFLENLSKETRERFGPHPLTEDGAKEICQNLDGDKTLRLVAFNNDNEIVGYFILDATFPQNENEDERVRYQRKYTIALNDKEDVRLAPVVADNYQDTGLGSVLMKNTLQRAQALGKRNVVLFGGVQESNERAVHFYEKNGFTRAGEFDAPAPGGKIVKNIDMYINLKQHVSHSS